MVLSRHPKTKLTEIKDRIAFWKGVEVSGLIVYAPSPCRWNDTAWQRVYG